MTVAAQAGRGKRRQDVPATPQAADLLDWYDQHRRVLPWRALPGETQDPYRVWLSEIMLQQTTVKAVAPYYQRFLERWPDVSALAAAPLEDVLRLWAGLGYYARARNLHACAKAVAERHGGVFPASEAELAALPGVGPYTAAAIAAIAFDLPTSPVDGNIERVMSRLFAVEDELPGAKPIIRRLSQSLTPQRRAGDFAQAMMDLGATICTPKSPACVLCPWTGACIARAAGTQETFPRKAPKTTGKLRRGSIFVALRADNQVLVRSRPEKGLLGGMTEFPGGDWAHDMQPSEAAAPFVGPSWKQLPGVVTHTFTHFPLELTVYIAKLGKATTAPAGMRWVHLTELHAEALPNVMRKVAAHAFPSTPQTKLKENDNDD